METERYRRMTCKTHTYAEQGEDPLPVKTVLIVEDDAAIGEVLLDVLQEATSYQIIHVLDGFAALKVVRTLIPHLILLDYWLPGMDGLECLDTLRTSNDLLQTPVILMSSALPQQARERSDLTLLEKPFEMDTLLTLIRHLLLET